MKKSTLLNLASALLAIFLFVGTQAQTNTGSGGPNGWLAKTTLGDYTSAAGNKVTYGKAMPFFVWPSSAFNPNWDQSTIVPFAAKAVIINNVSSSFAWSATGGATVTAPPADKNYAEISWPFAALGAQTITVTETGSGGCSGTPVTYSVTVIDQPSATITTTGSAQFGLTNIIQYGCGNQTTSIPLTGLNTGEVTPHAFYLNYTSYTVNGLDGSGNLPNAGGNLDKTGLTDLADKLVKGADNTNAATATSNPVITVTTGAATANMLAAPVTFPVVLNKITVYELDLTGYNAKVSRTSDYLVKSLTAVNSVLWNTYTQYGTAGKYYIVALPTPQTGPIYHISNSFGL